MNGYGFQISSNRTRALIEKSRRHSGTKREPRGHRYPGNANSRRNGAHTQYVEIISSTPLILLGLICRVDLRDLFLLRCRFTVVLSFSRAFCIGQERSRVMPITFPVGHDIKSLVIHVPKYLKNNNKIKSLRRTSPGRSVASSLSRFRFRNTRARRFLRSLINSYASPLMSSENYKCYIKRAIIHAKRIRNGKKY